MSANSDLMTLPRGQLVNVAARLARKANKATASVKQITTHVMGTGVTLGGGAVAGWLQGDMERQIQAGDVSEEEAGWFGMDPAAVLAVAVGVGGLSGLAGQFSTTAVQFGSGAGSFWLGDYVRKMTRDAETS